MPSHAAQSNDHVAARRLGGSDRYAGSSAGLGFATNRFAAQRVLSCTPRSVAPFEGVISTTETARGGGQKRQPSLATPLGIASPRAVLGAAGRRLAATYRRGAFPRRPRIAHSSLAGRLSAKNKRADITEATGSRTTRGRPNARSIFGRSLSPRLRSVMARLTFLVS